MIPVLDHGHVTLLRVDGADADIAAAARTSTGKTAIDPTKDARLIDRLLRDEHWSPFEQAGIQVAMDLPIFVMRQLVRHRTIALNEYSGRYSEMLETFHVPELARMQAQSTFNKQGSAEMLPMPAAERCHRVITAASERAWQDYQQLLAAGLTRELARVVLPVNFYTRIVARVSVRAAFDFLRLRLDSHAQYEIRVYAEALLTLLRDQFPASTASFERHLMGSRRVSAQALAVLVRGEESDDPEVVQIRREVK